MSCNTFYNHLIEMDLFNAKNNLFPFKMSVPYFQRKLYKG